MHTENGPRLRRDVRGTSGGVPKEEGTAGGSRSTATEYGALETFTELAVGQELAYKGAGFLEELKMFFLNNASVVDKAVKMFLLLHALRTYKDLMLFLNMLADLCRPFAVGRGTAEVSHSTGTRMYVRRGECPVGKKLVEDKIEAVTNRLVELSLITKKKS